MSLRALAVYETTAIAAALEREGCALVREAVPADHCAHAQRMIDALRPLHWDEVHAIHGRFLDRYLCVFNRDPFWLQFLDRPGLIDLAESVLGADCHVIGMTAWRSHPGYRPEPLHADYLPFAAPETDIVSPVFIITVHYYLSPVSADSAPTRIIPGSHRAARPPRTGEHVWNGCAPQIVLAQPGDALVFRSDVWHAGSDNRTTNEVRYLLQVHYGRREMAQHFTPFMDWRFDPAVLAGASRRQRRLLGEHEPGPYD